MNIIQAIEGEKLFRPLFKDLATWTAWITLLKALFGLPMSRKERRLYHKCTGRRKAPERAVKELWCICGRRGGKSFVASLVAVFLALFYNYQEFLNQGEKGIIQVTAADRQQAGVILGYIKGILNSNPVFQGYVASELKESIELNNGITIQVTTCSYRTSRGYTILCGIFDEAAFWRTAETGANPDKEILRAVRPGMATVPTSMLLVLSSPYAKSGILFEAFQDYYGKPDMDVLVWRAPSLLMNPTLSKQLIKSERKKDSVAAKSEWDAEFRKDVESYISREVLESCVVKHRRELPPVTDIRYSGFTDPSGGSGADSMTLAISHSENDIKVLDLVREIKPPFSPREAVAEFASLLQRYHITTVIGDRYASEWPRERFREYGINYQVSAKNKSELYRNFLPILNSRQCELLDIDVLVNQLLGLERTTGRLGKDSVDHLRGQHDDLANAAAGALAGGKAGIVPRISFVNTGEPAQKTLPKEKPKLGPGEQLIEVYDGQGFCGYEKIGGGPRPWLPLHGNGDDPSWLH